MKDAAFAAAGIDIDSDVLRAFAARHDPDGVPRTLQTLLQAATDALNAPEQYNLIGHIDGLALAVHVGDRIVLGLKHGASLKPWKLERLFKDRVRNRKAVEAWANAKSRAKDSIVATAKVTVSPVIGAHAPNGAALLAAVIAEPDNVAARSVYADWLIEQGDVRGELVHLACELELATGERREALAARAKELETKHHAWIAARAPYADDLEIRGGLIEGIAMYASKLPKYAPALAEHPLRRLTLYLKNRAELARVAKLRLPRVDELVIEARESPHSSGATIGLPQLADTRWPSSLRRLTLRFVSDKVAAWVSFWKKLDAPALEALELHYPGFGAGGYAGLPPVRELVLFCPGFSHQDMRPATAYAVCDVLAKQRFERVVLRSWHLGDAPLARCIGTLNADEIVVENCTTGDAVAAALSRIRSGALSTSRSASRRTGSSATTAMARRR